METKRRVQRKRQNILALLFLIGSGSAFSQSGTQYPINDPRNPNCPCHKHQQLAEQQYRTLLANANRPVQLKANKNETETFNTKHTINPLKLNEEGISAADTEKELQQLFGNPVSGKNILEEGISSADNEKNKQLADFQKNVVPEEENPVNQGISFAGNEIDNFMQTSQAFQFHQSFSFNGRSGSGGGISGGSRFKHKHSSAHTKYKRKKHSCRYNKWRSRLDYRNWDFLKEARVVAACYRWR